MPTPALRNIAMGQALQTERPSRSSERVRALDPESALCPLLEVLTRRVHRPKPWMPAAYRVDSDMRMHSITGSGDRGGSRVKA
jgi:hypothetical protein